MEDTQTITIEQFIAKHGIKFDCKRIESRPDGLMSDTAGETPSGKFHNVMRHFKCRITAQFNAGHVKGCTMQHNPNSTACIVDPDIPAAPRSFGLYFSQGSGHTQDPTLADVLDCLANDASGFENAKPAPGFVKTGETVTFNNWAEEYGYDTDSRKAEKTFKAIKRQAEQLKRTIGPEAYEELLYNTERM